MDNYEVLLSKIDERLSAENFKLWRKISMHDVLDTDIFATRIRWKIARYSEHIFLQYRVSPKCEDFEQLFTQALPYARRAYPISLPKQLWTNYRLIGCIATTNVRPDLIAYVTRRPSEHWRRRIVHGYFQLPVLIDLDSGAIHFYHGMFCVELQRMIRQFIAN